MIGMAKRPKLSLEMSPTVRLWPRCRLWARSLGRKASSLAAGDDASRVAGFSRPPVIERFRNGAGC